MAYRAVWTVTILTGGYELSLNLDDDEDLKEGIRFPPPSTYTASASLAMAMHSFVLWLSILHELAGPITRLLSATSQMR